MMDKILVGINHTPQQIKHILKGGFQLFEGQPKNKIMGFISQNVLKKNLRKLNIPPLLFMDILGVNKLAQEYPLECIDAKIDDVIHYHENNKEKLKKLVHTKFKAIDTGRNSVLSKTIKSYQLTIPSCTHIPFLTALTNCIYSGNLNAFIMFINQNRLCTQENKKPFKRLIAYLDMISDP